MVQSNRKIVFIWLSLAILLTDAVFIASNYYLSKKALHGDLNKEVRGLFLAFMASQKDTIKNLQVTASVIANDHQVQQLFLQGKRAVESEGGGAGGDQAASVRQQLYALLGPRWKDAMHIMGARQLHFHLGPGSLSFLRVHRPEKYGDRMDDVRHIIVDANKDHQIRGGFETGRVYSGIRGVVPVFAEDDQGGEIYVGALESGVSYKNLVQSFNQATGTRVSILLNKDHVSASMWPDFIANRFDREITPCGCYVESTSTPIPPGLFDKIERHEGKHVKDGMANILGLDSQYLAVSFFPLRDYQGDQDQTLPDAGSIMLWSDVTVQIEGFRRSQWFNLIYALVGFMVIESLLYLGFRKATRHLESEVSRRVNELADSEQRWKFAMDGARDGLWDWDTVAGRVYYSRNWKAMLGYDERDVGDGLDEWRSRVHPDDLEATLSVLSKHFAGQSNHYQVEFRMKCKDGSYKWILARGKVIEWTQAHEPKRVIGTHTDITERKQAEREIKDQHRFLQTIIDSVAEPILVISTDYKIISMNKSARDAYETDTKDPCLKCHCITHKSDQPCQESHYPCPLKEVMEDKRPVTVVHTHQTTAGERVFELVATPLFKSNGELLGIVETSRDITEQQRKLNEARESEARMMHLAQHDALTGLPNRFYLIDRLKQSVSYANRHDLKLALLFIDLDGFKDINDTYGHQQGDEVLKYIARRLRESVRVEDTLARLGGDEFVVLIDSITDQSDAANVADKMVKLFNQLIQVDGETMRVTMSIGISIYPDDGLTADGLLEKADAAMYQAKEKGKNCFQLS